MREKYHQQSSKKGRRYTQDITDDLIVTDNRTAFQQRV